MIDDDMQGWHQMELEHQQWEEENKKASGLGRTEANLRSPFSYNTIQQTDDSKTHQKKTEEI